MTKVRASIGNRIAPARYLLFLALLPAAYFAYRAVTGHGGWDGAAMAFDAAAVVFLLSLVPLLRDGTPASMRAAAAANDANRVTILALTTLLTIVAMAAIAGEMERARAGDLVAIVKLGGTLLLIWAFANSVYALHYAHMFYTRGKAPAAMPGGSTSPAPTRPSTAISPTSRSPWR